MVVGCVVGVWVGEAPRCLWHTGVPLDEAQLCEAAQLRVGLGVPALAGALIAEGAAVRKVFG